LQSGTKGSSFGSQKRWSFPISRKPISGSSPRTEKDGKCQVTGCKRGFYENVGSKVAAALRRGASPGQTRRRSEIGSHAPRKTAIFIRRGDLKKVMGHSYENAGFGSHDKSLLVCRGL